MAHGNHNGGMPGRRWRRPLAVVATLALLTVGAHAEFGGSADGPPPLTAAEQAIVADNPALVDLASSNPWVLRQALLEIEGAGADIVSRDSSGPAIDTSTIKNPADVRLIKTNPALRELWRITPDPALALLSLIRSASGK